MVSLDKYSLLNYLIFLAFCIRNLATSDIISVDVNPVDVFDKKAKMLF